jgi:hypothetical protein
MNIEDEITQYLGALIPIYRKFRANGGKSAVVGMGRVRGSGKQLVQ